MKTWDTSSFPGIVVTLIHSSVNVTKGRGVAHIHIHRVKEPNSQARFVRVMLMKALTPFLDAGSTPATSTKGAGELVSRSADSLREPRNLLIGACLSDGGAPDSTGSVVCAGDIRKAISVTKQTIIVKPMTMAAAA